MLLRIVVQIQKGVWNDEHCFLGHRRLSIIDLSEAGNQPFFSQDKRYVMVYNGELYNYKELKLELQEQSMAQKIYLIFLELILIRKLF
jgi:asparagine synthetase B (glutamine-hydrolysing)